MKVTFTYDRKQDVWCLLNYGKGSMNSATRTNVYEQFVSLYGENITEENASKFIDGYMLEHAITIDEYVSQYQKEWDAIANRYADIAERVFGISLHDDVTAYLSINNRCPYSIKENSFFISIPSYATKTAMHELWHFYTWYAFGSTWEDTLGKQAYNEIKEALTVLLNVECKELLPEGTEDRGYPQHQELRNKILTLWENNKNIHEVWSALCYKTSIN